MLRRGGPLLPQNRETKIVSGIILYAHRGSNPYPDHSLEAYVWAVNWGADVIEPDLFLTKDGVLVASHDNIPEGFANITYAEALARDPALMTFDQVIELAKELSAQTGREIGVIPETKDTGYATTEAVIKALVAHDFTDPSRVVIQSFSATNLKWLVSIANGTGGTVALDARGNIVFTPDAGFAGEGSFAYTITDGHGTTSTATVAVQVVDPYADWTRGSLQREALSGARLADRLYGDAGNDTLAGGSEDDQLAGGSGNDQLEGGLGNDLLKGGTGNDRLLGGAGNDILLGGAGNDILEGGAGDDRFEGGAGNDVMNGGLGQDVFIFGANSGADTIFSFKHGDDRIELHGVGLTGFDALFAAMADTSQGVVITFGEDGEHQLLLSNISKATLHSHDFVFA